jgi:uncharacterized protein YbjT (DUF2867 family)
MAAPKKVDYEAIEPGWRAGIKSVAQLAAEYTEATGIKCSRPAIIKHFAKLGVPRDLSAKVRAKADAMVAEAMVTGTVTPATTIAEAAIIEAAAVDVATVRISHRRDITRFRALVLKLLAECEAEAADPAIFQQIGEILRRPDDNQQDKLNDAYMKAISLPQRIKGVKELADTLKTLVGLEREAYGIATEPEKPPADDGKLPDPEAVARRIASLLDKPEVAGAILAKLQAQLQAKKE